MPHSSCQPLLETPLTCAGASVSTGNVNVYPEIPFPFWGSLSSSHPPDLSPSLGPASLSLPLSVFLAFHLSPSHSLSLTQSLALSLLEFSLLVFFLLVSHSSPSLGISHNFSLPPPPSFPPSFFLSPSLPLSLPTTLHLTILPALNLRVCTK